MTEELRSERDRLRRLIELAHPVMRECGWHLATAAEPISDGVLEAACSEIEQKFAEELQGVRAPTDVDKLRKALKTFETMVRDDDYDAEELIEEFAEIARNVLAETETKADTQPIYYMRDNHTFKRLSNDVSTALVEIEQEFNQGFTCGSLCSKRDGFPMVHAHGSEKRMEFFAECKLVLEKHLKN